MKKLFLLTIGNRIRSLRKSRGLTQEALGWKAGIASKHVGAIERCETNASVLVLYKIACGLEIDLATLLQPDKELRCRHDERINYLLQQANPPTREKIAQILEILLENGTRSL